MFGFGQRLKNIRKGEQLTQAELAEKLAVSVQSISKWECGNGMPDISQIVPLAAVLGVTTDCLLGVGSDEKTDRETLYRETEKLKKGIDRVYRRDDDSYYRCYELYKAHLKKYPLDYEVKLLCADSLIRCLYYRTDAEEMKERFYREAIALLRSIINCDRDTTRVIDAQQTLVILYLYRKDFANAEETARALPQKGGIRAAMEIEICSGRNDHGKCIELSENVCREAIHHYLWALAIRAKRLSLAGSERKQDAITAWHDLVREASSTYEIFRDEKIRTKWLYSALNHLSNDYIATNQADKALETVEELAKVLLQDYSRRLEHGDHNGAEELKSNFYIYLHGCYDQHYATCDNEIANHRKFQSSERLLGIGK